MNILRISRKKRKRKSQLNTTRLILIIILFMMTTLAWFTYSRFLDADINLHINSWNIEFYLDDVKQETPLNISLDGLYPSMEDKVIDLTIKNTGETGANISYKITNFKMFGKIYKVVKEPLEDDEFYILETEPTVKEGISTKVLLNEEKDGVRRFPFELQIENSTEVNPDQDGHFKVTAKWDGTNDDLDLKWGHDAAEFYENTGDAEDAISFTLEIEAIGKPRDEGV